MSQCPSGSLQILGYPLFIAITIKAFLSTGISRKLLWFSLLTGEAALCLLKTDFLVLKMKIRAAICQQNKCHDQILAKTRAELYFVSCHPWAQWRGKGRVLSLVKCLWSQGEWGWVCLSILFPEEQCLQSSTGVATTVQMRAESSCPVMQTVLGEGARGLLLLWLLLRATIIG